ncbi:REP-associated tyrosine transposase [Flavobacterium defluvii]|uniref:REP element-mobilizing transposase RayT n=1 Tax=Flavobacterium defluvii TaxID=370979 RepID=A0A1M5E6C8_9FLAO|nr:transposase [Flavobacterium defluvii]SHF74632.1 REP element-mobilizing transposase RayT [Flavobacterium defluvii]
MKEGYIIRDQRLPHFITPTVVDWIDIFTRQCYRDIVIESLKYCIENKGMILYGYVIMSNHIHLIIQSENGKLSDLIRDFKKFTAKNILEKIQNSPESRREWMLERFKLATQSHSRNKEYQFWQYGNHAEEIYTNEFMWSKLDYIHLNPVKAGLVVKASDYIYSSASNYLNDSGMLQIEKADNLIVNVFDKKSIVRYNQY